MLKGVIDSCGQNGEGVCSLIPSRCSSCAVSFTPAAFAGNADWSCVRPLLLPVFAVLCRTHRLITALLSNTNIGKMRTDKAYGIPAAQASPELHLG